ncbi:hypothetical protein BT69DRAFT_1348700 [Atractiella rhizophila]|nr:hypothetical protein BT69DRAFT_1348700 [Atractiella rhizophila]
MASTAVNGARRGKERTLDDLSVKTCWICYEEEVKGDPATATANGKKRRWVHPCTCTLLAHEDCLLRWIAQAQSNPRREDREAGGVQGALNDVQQGVGEAAAGAGAGNQGGAGGGGGRNREPIGQAVKCPSCGTEYELVETEPSLLRAIERFHKRLARVSVYGMFGFTAVGVASGLLKYGTWATYMFLGKEAGLEILPPDAPWPIAHYFNVTLILPALICSRVRLADPLLPLLPLSIFLSYQPSLLIQTTPLPHPPYFAITVAPDPSSLFSNLLDISWPPSPYLVLLLLPWIRKRYFALRKWTFGVVLNTVSAYIGTSAVYRDGEGLREVDDGEREREREGAWANLGRWLLGAAGAREGGGRRERIDVVPRQQIDQVGEGGMLEVRIDFLNPDNEQELRRERQIEMDEGLVHRGLLEMEGEEDWTDDEEEEEDGEEAPRRGGDGRRRHPPQARPLDQVAAPPPPQQEVQPAAEGGGGQVEEEPEEWQIVIPETTSFSRLVVGALVFPLVSNYAGSFLRLIATRSFHGQGISWLKTLLGIGKTYHGPLRRTLQGEFLGSRLRGSWRDVEPVWLRNFWGASMVLLVRDCIELIRECLELKRIKSRRVKGRPLGDLMFE